jgi:hypothetical protein
MQSRVTTAQRYDRGSSTSAPSTATARWKRAYASCTMSSASVTLPSIR